MNVDDVWINLVLLLQTLNWLDWLDLLLVTLVFFGLITALQRAQATFIVRGLALVGLLLLPIAFLLPLPTFSLLVRGIMLFMIIAIPVLFQRELRHLLEDLGRRIGLTPFSRRETEGLVQPLMRAIHQMASQQIGVLIALEGEMDLTELVETGVAIDGRVSSELLTAIFFGKNPLHDGATIIRGQSVVAAACILPLSQREIHDPRHVGTRHRAAVGLSEQSDALVLVVSEETGDISIAEEGKLQKLEEEGALRERIVHFARRSVETPSSRFSLDALFNRDTGKLHPPFARRLRRGAVRFGMALLFAVSLWGFELRSTTDLPDVDIEGVPLQVEGPPSGLIIASKLPETVDLVVRTIEGASSAFDEEGFVAKVFLDELSDGVHRLPVQVTSRLNTPVEILDVDPEMVEVDLATVGQRTFSVTIKLETASLSPVYKVEDTPEAVPEKVEVKGPQPLIEQVAAVQATLSLSNTQGLVEVTQPLQPVDANGQKIEGVTVDPAQAEVRVNVERRPNVREMGVALVVNGEPASGYWISGLTAQPATIIVSGSEDLLSQLGGAVPTQPINISGAAGDVRIDVPLEIPAEVSVQTPAGESVKSIRAMVRVTARRSNLTVERPVELQLSPPSLAVNVNPEQVELLLSGPVATLQEIEADPGLVRVTLAVNEESLGENGEQTPRVIAPENISVQLVPSQVTVSRP